MLNILFGKKAFEVSNVIKNPSAYFDAEYEESWFQSDIAKSIVEGIDSTKYSGGSHFESPVLGGISPRELSTGCKSTLLLLNEDDIIICGERFGDNCCSWLLKIAEFKDITITLNHIMKFKEPFTIRSLNDNILLSSYKDYINYLVDLSSRGSHND